MFCFQIIRSFTITVATTVSEGVGGWDDVGRMALREWSVDVHLRRLQENVQAEAEGDGEGLRTAGQIGSQFTFTMSNWPQSISVMAPGGQYSPPSPGTSE